MTCSAGYSHSEEILGYSRGAKTLSNHFRGICYKALCFYINRGGEDEKSVVRLASRAVMGENGGPHIEHKLVRKMEKFLDRAKNAGPAELKRQKNNLPVKYLTYLIQLNDGH